MKTVLKYEGKEYFFAEVNETKDVVCTGCAFKRDIGFGDECILTETCDAERGYVYQEVRSFRMKYEDLKEKKDNVDINRG